MNCAECKWFIVLWPILSTHDKREPCSKQRTMVKADREGCILFEEKEGE